MMYLRKRRTMSDNFIVLGDIMSPTPAPVAQAPTPVPTPDPTPVQDPVIVGPEPSKNNIYAHAAWVGAAVLATAVAPFIPFLGAPEPVTGVAVGLAISVLAALAKFL